MAVSTPSLPDWSGRCNCSQTEGVSAMAAIVAGDGFDLEAFAEHLSQRLPAYAIPLFLRLSERLDATETFKQKKHQLAREGFDPAAVSDPLYFRDPRSFAYRPLDAFGFAGIAKGEIRL